MFWRRRSSKMRRREGSNSDPFRYFEDKYKKAYEIVLLFVCRLFPLIIARQELGKDVPAATNTHETLENFLDGSFSLQSVSHERKAGY
jgi:hypothetical protein